MNARVNTSGDSTSHQRLYARSLLLRMELSTHRFGCSHRPAFKAAGLPEPPMDGDVDTHLRALTKPQASALIKALEKQAGTTREDDDQ